eukprot:6294443-Pyramimonas_sp.AAC.1
MAIGFARAAVVAGSGIVLDRDERGAPADMARGTSERRTAARDGGGAPQRSARARASETSEDRSASARERA